MTESGSIKQLLESGAHFGHQTSRWHPRMKSYIFTQRNGIHIIDLQQTVTMLQKARDFARELAIAGENILFVGTKKQAQESVQQEAERCGMPYVSQRWLGGMLTNFGTIQARIDYLVRLEDRMARGGLERLPKKELMKLEKEIARLNRLLGGFKEMTEAPGSLFLVDPTKDHIALAEAKRVGIPVVAIVDTNCDPIAIDHPIPANDDAIRAIKFICARISDAVIEGRAARQSVEETSNLTDEKIGVDEQPHLYSFAPEEETSEDTGAEISESEALEPPKTMSTENTSLENSLGGQEG